MNKLAVIGSGAWGTAIANLLANNGQKVILWSFEKETVENINQHHENKIFLPNIPLSNNITATNDFNDIADVAAIFTVIPAQFTKQTLEPLKIASDIPIVICSKGIENKSHKLLSDVLVEIFPDNPIAAMSGPNFADEVAVGKSAITTIACSDINQAKKIASFVNNDNFKPRICKDVIGVELAGAIKNVIAIAMGIASGLDLSESSKAAIFTKGLNETADLSKAWGGRRKTSLEPCGVGDLLLTCSSRKSRNMSLGYALGKGEKLEDILAKRKTVAEGVATTKAAYEIMQKLNLDSEIINAVYQILYQNKSPEKFFS